MGRQNLSQADDYFAGRIAYNRAFSAKRGLPASLPFIKDLGAIVQAAAGALLSAATSTELPNNTTITYTFPASSASPQDGALNSGVMDVPRAVAAVTTHASSVVAMTVLVTGTDEYGEAMSELITVPATGTSQTVAGKKAFKTVTSVAVASAGNATTNTLNLGTSDVIGLPFRVDAADMCVVFLNGVSVDAATLVRAVTSAATTTSGDIRGTFNPSASIDSTNRFQVLLNPSRNTSKERSYGVAQA